jgi:hypothetical protein
MQTPVIATRQRKYQSGLAVITTTTFADIVTDVGTIAGAGVFRQDTGVLITFTIATNIITVTQAALSAVPCYWFAVGDAT